MEPGISRLRIPALPGVSKPIVRYSTGIITARCVRTAVARTDWPVEGVINASPIMKFPSGPCGVRLLHVTDDWFAGSTLMGFSPVFLRQILLSNLAMADAITAVSEGLAEKVSVLAGKSVGVLANGCTPLDTAPGLVRRPLVAWWDNSTNGWTWTFWTLLPQQKCPCLSSALEQRGGPCVPVTSGCLSCKAQHRLEGGAHEVHGRRDTAGNRVRGNHPPICRYRIQPVQFPP